MISDAVDLLKLLTLLTVANGAPVVASNFPAFNTPLDGGLQFYDGRPLFGASKTIRGVLASLVATSLLAELLGWHWTIGGSVAAAAMTGDLATSFVKRRLGLPLHHRATGLDQIPEAALPLLVIQGQFALGALDAAIVVALFAVVALVGSRAMFLVGMKDRPH